MKKQELLEVKNRQEWCKWLESNSASKKAIWLVCHKKHTNKPTIRYEEAVKEAVCFGWVDSTMNRLDEERFIQLFTPRNPKSLWSESNIARAKKMIKEGKMTPTGLKLYKDAMKAGQIAPATNEEPLSADLEKALKENKKAWENFSNLAPSYKLLYIYWVNNAKRDETRRTRIERSVKAAAQNKKFPNL